jgi:hypothetical protein
MEHVLPEQKNRLLKKMLVRGTDTITLREIPLTTVFPPFPVSSICQFAPQRRFL